MSQIKITIEGAQASGKTTLAKWIASQLEAIGSTVTITDDGNVLNPSNEPPRNPMEVGIYTKQS